MGNYIPFYDKPWKSDRKAHAHAIWEWYRHLRFDLPASAQMNPGEALKMEAERFRSGGTPLIMKREIWTGMGEACKLDGLAREDAAIQIESSVRFYGPLRFERFQDLRSLMEAWVHPHTRLLLGLAGITYRWQHEEWYPFAESLFLTGVIFLKLDVPY